MSDPRDRGTHSGEAEEDVDDETLLESALRVAYVTTGPPSHQREQAMRKQFRFARDRLARSGGHGFEHASSARPANTYKYDRLEDLRIHIYESKLDRVLMAAAGALAVVLGVLSFGQTVTVSTNALLSSGVAVAGLVAAFSSLQSARSGYLAQRNFNFVDDLAASLPVSVVRGHHRVHEEEKAVLERARLERSRVMMLDLWTRPRQMHESHEFAEVQQELDGLIDAAPKGQVRCVVGTNPENWPQTAELLQHRLGQVDQYVYLESPLQIDAVLTDGQVLLSFARPAGGRTLAFVVHSEAIIEELWDIVEAQLGETRCVVVREPADIDEIKALVHSRAWASDPTQ